MIGGMKWHLQSLPRQHVQLGNCSRQAQHVDTVYSEKTKEKRKKIIRDTLKSTWSWPPFTAFGVSR